MSFQRSHPLLLSLLLLLLNAAACATPRIMDIRTFPSTKRAVSELQRDMADAVVGDYPVVAFEARESAGRFEVTGRPFAVETLGIGVGTLFPGGIGRLVRVSFARVFRRSLLGGAAWLNTRGEGYHY